MSSAKLIQKLKPALQNLLPPEQDGILLCLYSDSVTGNNAKYMKMYNRLARWYDFGERWIARLRYGNSINETRRSLMGELEWRQDCTALYVSIGTGTDLNHLPADIDPAALDLTGADLSLGMLERCRNVWQKKAAGLDLVHCNAEDLPFADNMFDVVFHVGGINFFTRNYFQDTDFDLTQIENYIPETVQEKKTRLLWDNRFYCITFRKPV